MKQHYIPRCYLKRFSDNDKSIFTYDKQQSKAYPASMMSVCCEETCILFQTHISKKTTRKLVATSIDYH